MQEQNLPNRVKGIRPFSSGSRATRQATSSACFHLVHVDVHPQVMQVMANRPRHTTSQFRP